MSITPYSGIPFWIVTSAFIVINTAIIAIRADVSKLRSAIILVISLFVFYFAEVDATPKIILLILFSYAIYTTGNLLRANRTKNNKMVVLIAVAGVCAYLGYFKYSIVQDILHSLFAKDISRRHIYFIGVSYFCFKFIHYIVDCYRNKIAESSFLIFLNYVLFFPSFFAGPINRYNEFVADLKTTKTPEYVSGIKRIINGSFKKVVISSILLPYSFISLDFNDPRVTPLVAIIGVYAYMLYIYFDFSGYTDMAIGTAQLVGIRLPENFNYPFFKRNLQQFWANWHMSLTTWLTDYIYWPIARKLRHVKSISKKPVTTSNVCIIITFVVCGIWHGDGINFFIWGCYHGIGLAILNIYGYLIKKYASLKYRKFVATSKISYGISMFINLQYVAFGFLIFGLTFSEIKEFFMLF